MKLFCLLCKIIIFMYNNMYLTFCLSTLFLVYFIVILIIEKVEVKGHDNINKKVF